MFAPPVKGGEPTPGLIKAIRHIDHVTYVTALDSERNFIDRWSALGFAEHVRLRSHRYPATHIALVSGSTPEYPWATMTGLSISEDPNSPVNEFVHRYGEHVQHVAYNIHPQADMEDIHLEMKDNGWNFMTPVLTYKDSNGAKLRQMFIAPELPFGAFLEFIQRLPGPDGHPYDGFDSMNIDDLYEGYEVYSKKIDR